MYEILLQSKSEALSHILAGSFWEGFGEEVSVESTLDFRLGDV